MVASGVRRSWETAPTRGAWRSRSTSSSSCERRACCPELDPLEGQGGVVGEGAQQGPVGRRGRQPRRASMPTGRPDAVSATARSSSGGPCPVPDRLPAPRTRGSSRASSSVASGSPAEAADVEAVAAREEQGHRLDLEDGPDRLRRWSRADRSTDRSSTSSSDSSKSRRASPSRRWASARAGSQVRPRPGRRAASRPRRRRAPPSSGRAPTVSLRTAG